MWIRVRQCSLMALVSIGLGCSHPKSMVNTKQPPDPLLISKKPVEGKPTGYEPATAWHEPQAPSLPPRDTLVQQHRPVRSIPVGYRSAEDTGVNIGKPRWLPSQQ